MGYDYAGKRESAKRNMLSAREHPAVVQDYLENECSKGRVLGPFPPEAVPEVHVSRFGVIPKRGVNKWRLILDLRHQTGVVSMTGFSPIFAPWHTCRWTMQPEPVQGQVRGHS